MRAARLAASACLTLVLLAAGWPSAPRSVEVHLNGRALTHGLAFLGVGGEVAVYVPVSGLAQAIGGSAGTWRSWLRLEDLSLFAASEGGCVGCPVHIRRPVLISSRLRLIEGEPHLPLPDLVTAFEGRLGVDAPSGIYTIFAGRCTWCVLEAQDP